MPTGPLAGLRIVELAGIGPAPFAAMLLGDMGAEIIRIDRPGGADPWTKDIIRRGRRTLTLDLKNPAHLSVIKRLLLKSDALIEGFRPGVMERLGLGPEAVHALNPRLTYARISGWGQHGPLAQSAGHDITYIAITGALAAIGPEAQPVPPLNLVGDMGGGALYLAMGLLAGVLEARRTGKGRVVDCAISDCTASLMAMTADLKAQGRWQDGRAQNLLDGGAPFYRTYPCADGKFIAVGALEAAFFRQFCTLLGLDPVPSEDERLNPAHWPALQARIGALILTRSRDDWAAIFEGTDACVAPVLTLEEAPHHPHNIARKAFSAITGGMQPAPAPRFSGIAAVPPPLLPDFATPEEALTAWGT